MAKTEVHQCECGACGEGKAQGEREVHWRMNLLLTRLDEQQRRWYVAVESARIGYGGDDLLSQITGMDVKTIRRGRQELAEELEKRPVDRVRIEGGGRPRAEKETADGE